MIGLLDRSSSPLYLVSTLKSSILPSMSFWCPSVESTSTAMSSIYSEDAGSSLMWRVMLDSDSGDGDGIDDSRDEHVLVGLLRFSGWSCSRLNRWKRCKDDE